MFRKKQKIEIFVPLKKLRFMGWRNGAKYLSEGKTAFVSHCILLISSNSVLFWSGCSLIVNDRLPVMKGDPLYDANDVATCLYSDEISFLINIDPFFEMFIE